MTTRMGKRSNFERRERDFYATPAAAVPPLIPHLRLHAVRTFAEPCCGDGALVNYLEGFGLRCVYAGDIASGDDALARDSSARRIASSATHPTRFCSDACRQRAYRERRAVTQA
jgi:hypothetical protein